MTDTSAISSTGAVTYAGRDSGTGTATDKTSLGKDQFLQLLVTQMRYQDPSSPMDSNQIVAQTAQLSTVEQLTTLTSSQQNAFALQQRLSASSLVGQNVTWTGTDGTKHSGVVEATAFSASSTPTLTVGKDSVALDAVTGVTSGTPSTTSTTTKTS